MRTSLATLGALVVLPQAGAADTTPESILGLWSTPIAEQTASGGGASAFIREQVNFGSATNTLRLEAFADSAAQVPLFTYESIGPYRTLGPSETVVGALDLDAENDRSTVTIFQDAPEVWAALNLAACPLEIGVAVDIAGCVTGPPLNAAQGVELYLVSVDEAGLRLGARNTDRCITWPTALGETLHARE